MNLSPPALLGDFRLFVDVHALLRDLDAFERNLSLIEDGWKIRGTREAFASGALW